MCKVLEQTNGYDYKARHDFRNRGCQPADCINNRICPSCRYPCQASVAFVSVSAVLRAWTACELAMQADIWSYGNWSRKGAQALLTLSHIFACGHAGSYT